MPLLIFGAALIASNRNFTFIDDEVWILDGAAQPVRTTLALFRSGVGQHEHPPLYDILLHFWLRWTGGSFEYLRVPSILFFLAGLFLLARAAHRLGSPSSALAVVWLGALWPFGFYYGRLAAWYSFSFFLVAGLTLAYLRYVEDQSFGRWAVFFLSGVALLWTNYFGWALLGCLAIDQFIRHRFAERVVRPAVLAGTAALFGVAYVPLFRAFRHEIATGVNVHHGATAVIANAAFNVYSLFVSESVAPWHWFLSVPAGLAVLACVLPVLLYGPRSPRRFLLYGALLIAVMAVTGILVTKRLFLVAPWILLPIGVAVGTDMPRRARFGLALALLAVGGIGWFGIYSRHYYSALRFIEPWPTIAEDAANKIQGGATVIANNPSFFFYLTYALRVPGNGAIWKFAGVLPDDVRHPRVTSADKWLASGHPLATTMIWIRGMADPQTQGPMDDAAHELGQSCGAQTSRLMMRDEGYPWRQRFFPGPSGLPWRIQVREYDDCVSTNSKEILHIPLR
ncbi:MAG: glycosyltransferase family 39 protein [Acidobacteriia bacterium]|nr:glycosyltransferase family 39 protein [Terriglobia bacterium]